MSQVNGFHQGNMLMTHLLIEVLHQGVALLVSGTAQDWFGDIPSTCGSQYGWVQFVLPVGC